MVKETELQRMAKRLHASGRIFLDIDPEAKMTGIAKDVDRTWMPEDAELPEYKSPNADEIDLAVHNANYNRKMRAIPTSVESTTTISIQRGVNPQTVNIIHKTTRVDLGYKIPKISFNTGSAESDREAAADFLTQNIRARQNRTNEERKQEEWNETMRKTL